MLVVGTFCMQLFDHIWSYTFVIPSGLTILQTTSLCALWWMAPGEKWTSPLLINSELIQSVMSIVWGQFCRDNEIHSHNAGHDNDTIKCTQPIL